MCWMTAPFSLLPSDAFVSLCRVSRRRDSTGTSAPVSSRYPLHYTTPSFLSTEEGIIVVGAAVIVGVVFLLGVYYEVRRRADRAADYARLHDRRNGDVGYDPMYDDGPEITTPQRRG